jgi:hypothetical protein
MTVGFKDFNVIPIVAHKDSGYSFTQVDDVVIVTLPGGTTIASIPIPPAWLALLDIIDVVGIKVLAVEWLEENWEGK